MKKSILLIVYFTSWIANAKVIQFESTEDRTLRKLIENVLKENKNLRAELYDLIDKYSNIETELTDLKSSLKSDLVMFSAYSNTNELIQEGKVVKFNKFWVNNGDVIDLDTGKFKAPLDGNYEFTFNGHSSPGIVAGYGLQIQVMKNNNNILRFSTGDDEHFENLSNTWTLQLKAGDIIKLSVRNGALFTSSNHFRTFTGKLL